MKEQSEQPKASVTAKQPQDTMNVRRQLAVQTEE
jgi:hypothetical protein